MSLPEQALQAEAEPFSASGTLLVLDIRGLQGPAEGLPPDRLRELMEGHLDHVIGVVARHSGVIHRFIGDAVEAYWLDGTKPSASAAFSCALDLLADPMPRSVPRHVKYQLDISLATGEMVGAYFGPIRQLQIIGSARNNADRVTAIFGSGNGLRVCQETFKCLKNTDLLCPITTVERGSLEPLTIHGLKAEVRPRTKAKWPWL